MKMSIIGPIDVESSRFAIPVNVSLLIKNIAKTVIVLSIRNIIIISMMYPRIFQKCPVVIFML